MTNPPVANPTQTPANVKWGLRILTLLLIVILVAWNWNIVLHTLGLGILIAATAFVIAAVIIERKKYSFVRDHWHQWLGGIVLALLVFGILGFIVPVSGPLQEYSLGGNLGATIIGHSRSVEGVSRLIGLAVVAVALFTPHYAWRVARTSAKKGAEWSREAYNRGQSLLTRFRDYYKEHPWHERIADKFRRHPTPSPEGEGTTAGVQEASSVLPQSTGAAPAKASRTRGKKSLQLELDLESAVTAANSRLSGRWQLPSVDLLDKPTATEFSPAEMERRAKIIEEALGSYGVEAKVVETNPGPAVTQFGVDPGWDRKYKEIKVQDKDGNVVPQKKEVSKTRVKVERIKALENNIALALAASSIRIEAPIPGKSLVGIEVPNSAMSLVTLRETVESPNLQKLMTQCKLAIALGKGSAGEMIGADLAKMPHLLIAGATGSGKTVCLDSIIASLLMNNTPDELQIVMIDPKRVELIAFEGLPHLTAPVVTDADRTVVALKWLTHEMDGRYRKLASVGANNIDAYNKSPDRDRPLLNIVLIIDELADLMMAKQADVEPLICRLAQMGRAVGIHEVIATQRPSVDVITGLIKANFPTRISFALVSRVDSITILDNTGAEKLLGRGDMLFLPADAAKPTRLQGCFVSQEEIRRVVSFWIDQQQPQAVELPVLPEVVEQDPLVEQAKQLIKEHKHVSAVFLQRQLRIGHGRAEQILQLLEKEALESFKQPTEVSNYEQHQ